MSLRNVTIYNNGSDAITLAQPNGGVARDLVSSPTVVQGGLQLIYSDDTNAAFRRTLTFRSKPPVYDAKAKTWSKQRREIAASDPVEITPGVMQSLTVRLIVEAPATSTAEDILRKIDEVITAAKDSEAELFLKVGTLD